MLGAGPIGGCRVLETEDVQQVLGVCFTNAFDTEIIDDQRESDGVIFVLEQSGGVSGGHVAMLFEMNNEFVVCDFAGARKAAHATSDFEAEATIVDEMMEVAAVHDLFRCIRDGHAHAFAIFDRGVKTEIFDVESSKLGVFGGQCAIDEALRNEQVSCLRACFAFEHSFVASHG